MAASVTTMDPANATDVLETETIGLNAIVQVRDAPKVPPGDKLRYLVTCPNISWLALRGQELAIKFEIDSKLESGTIVKFPNATPIVWEGPQRPNADDWEVVRHDDGTFTLTQTNVVNEGEEAQEFKFHIVVNIDGETFNRFSDEIRVPSLDPTIINSPVGG